MGPASEWPSFACAENGGQGWTCDVVNYSSRRSAATVALTAASATSALASAESLMVVYDDFESGATFGDHGYNLTSPCGSCFIPTDQDPSAFTITEETEEDPKKK